MTKVACRRLRRTRGQRRKKYKKKFYTYEGALALTWKRPIFLFLLSLSGILRPPPF
jgi:hypothetical protein